MSTGQTRKPAVWLTARFRKPPFEPDGQQEAGDLLRQLQDGVRIGLPHSRPMPSIGTNCHELRVRDKRHNWRVFYRIDADAIVVIEWSPKTTEKTPQETIDLCKKRLREYDGI